MNPESIVYLLFLTLAGTIVLGIYSFRHRQTPGATPFFWMMVTAAIWTVCAALEWTSTDFETKLFWFNAKQVGPTGIPIIWLFLAMEYTGHNRWIRGRRWMLFCIFPLITNLLAWTSAHHQILRLETYEVLSYGLEVITTRRGPWYWISLVYGTVSILTAFALLIDWARRTPAAQRRQAIGLIVAMIIPIAPQFQDVVMIGEATLPTPVLFIPTGIILAVTLMRERLFDIMPIARDHIIENMRDPVIVVDPKGRIVDLNPAANQFIDNLVDKPHSTTNGSYIGQPVITYLPYWDSALANPTPSFEQICHDHSYDCTIQPIAVSSQSSLGHVIMIRDITARKQAEQQTIELAVQREKVLMLENFIQNASHDLRTPISVIKTSTYLAEKMSDRLRQNLITLTDLLVTTTPSPTLDEMKDSLARLVEKHEHIELNAKRLEGIVESLLEMARLENQPPLRLHPHDLNQFLKNCAADYHALMAEKGITLHLEPIVGQSQALMDETRLGDAVRKLLDNALHYTPAGGQVTLAAHCEGTHLTITVRDTGIGIAEKDQPHIFDRFYRADEARSTDTGGAGLGLPIARSIVEAHGGSITFQTALGQGSSFHITLPPSEPSTI
ncbi:MAG: PAS domain-containing protein [Anaerolineae bacterium]|nr:PAS domain-containing protein [Anaerolineae bacterium]